MTHAALPPGFHADVAATHADYLRDESRRSGEAASISFPRTEDELRAHLRAARHLGHAVTVQGARTGVTAGAVPRGGHILNLGRMNRVRGLRYDEPTGTFFVTAQPGVRLTDLRDALDRREFDSTGWSGVSLAALARLRTAPPQCFAPDPTETSASIGGMASCNASGALTFRYGPTRDYIQAVRVMLVDGDTLALSRAAPLAHGRVFDTRTEAGAVVRGSLPGYGMPHVKNASGYFAADDMPLLDLFIGSEGTLGVFTELELRLLPAPASVWGVTAFLPSDEAACAFVEEVRAAPCPPVAIEFFDDRALTLLRRQRATHAAFADIPAPPEGALAAVYVEFHGTNEDAVTEAVAAMSEAMVRHGGSEDTCWLASEKRDLLRIKAFRHAVPESVNLLIDERRRTEPRLTKLGTDLAVPDAALHATLKMYRDDLLAAGLEHVIFGHIGNNHVHVNVIPRDLAEYETGRRLYLRWAAEVVRLGGSVSAEHGIGKLKIAMLETMFGPAGIADMRRVKRIFDPDGLLNPGNLFDAKPASGRSGSGRRGLTDS
jgi:D-lactate dehydrogenase (cytochrome)